MSVNLKELYLLSPARV
jgi:hypothetical protein